MTERKQFCNTGELSMTTLLEFTLFYEYKICTNIEAQKPLSFNDNLRIIPVSINTICIVPHGRSHKGVWGAIPPTYSLSANLQYIYSAGRQ